MRIVTNNELSNYKVLPFDLYTEEKGKILEAGEILTPGKLIMLKNYSKIYTEDNKNFLDQNGNANPEEQTEIERMTNFTYESLDPQDFSTVVNKDASMPSETQIKIKFFYRKVLDLLLKGYYQESIIKLLSMVNVLKNVIYKQMNKTSKGSHTRFMGEYELCHPLNVAVVSGLIAKKLDYAARNFEELILAALLHDVGKLTMKVPGGLAYLTANEEEVYNHTVIGYKLIRENFGFPEQVALPALEHHENNDGSGYPQGLSSDYITKYSQIINVANYYDNLACNRTHILVTNNKEALRAMLEVGTKKFSAETLYTFINMFSYDDLKEFNDMIF